MPVCRNVTWTIDVITDSSAIVARVFFNNVTITGQDIRGDVELPIGTKISDLTGKCVPVASSPDVASVTFRFRLSDTGSEIGIFMSGVGLLRSAASFADFVGRWFAHVPDAQTPLATRRTTSLVLPGSGDTGTGTGMQT